MDNRENKSKYLRWLEMLEAKLKDIKALSTNGAKLAVLPVLYDLQRANEFFLQVKESASGSEYSHDLLKIDEDVDYADWSSKRLNIRPEIQRLYFDGEIAHASELQNVKNSLWGIVDALDASKLEELGVDKSDYLARLQNLLWGKIDDDLLLQALSKLLLQLRQTLAEIAKAMENRKLSLEDGVKLYEGLEFRFNLWKDNPIEKIWKNWLASFEDEDDWEVVKCHAVGRWYKEILLFFKSGFLTPKLENQQKADMADFIHEINFEYFQNVPEELDLQRNYSALRDLFHYSDKCFKPKKGAIGKYIFNQRKKVREEQRNALFRFIQIMIRLDELKKNEKHIPDKTEETCHTSIHESEAAEKTISPSDLTNDIFSPSLFKTAEQLGQLHCIIHTALQQLQGKNELFWVLMALDNAEVLNYHTADVAFVTQMQQWFPDIPCLKNNTRKITKAISTERKKWTLENLQIKITNLKTNKRALERQLKAEKIERCIKIAYEGLYKDVLSLKDPQ